MSPLSTGPRAGLGRALRTPGAISRRIPDAVFVETVPSRTGRERFRVIGVWSDGRIVTAILSPLGSQAWSLVSLRTASHNERRAYAQQNPSG